MHKLYEYVCDELKDLEKKAEKGNLSMQEVQYADTLAHLKKNLMKADEMMEDEFGEYSMAYYPMTSYAEEGGNKGRYGMSRRDGGYSYARGRGRNARRDSMGRYSREGGYSYADDEMHEIIADMRGMMADLPAEKQRKVREFIDSMERM